MQFSGLSRLAAGVLLALSFVTASYVQAGGSGLNTVVIINQDSPNSRELGNYFCERRQVPPENILRITWTGGNTNWSSDDFQARLLTPFLNMLTARQLTSQVESVVLSMDIPFLTLYGNKANGTTSALFYGLKDETSPNWWELTNSYYASEKIFRQARPTTAPGYSFLATMLTAGSLAQAKLLVDQGVDSDGTWPAQPAIFAKTTDPLRNIRYKLYDNALLNTRVLERATLVRTNSDSPWGQTNLFGYQTGLASFSVSTNTFIPGAMADHVSSFGGVIFGPNDQTSLMIFINAGAAGSYGTVVEPTPTTQKFPNPQNYFYQARGFTLAECYYQSVYSPYQGLLVGEPLAAPFARTAAGGWVGLASNVVLSGTAQLGVSFSGLDAGHRLQQVDLFVDGKYYQTLTNCAPRAGNQLKVILNGYPLTYTVASNATLASIAGGLATLLNTSANSNLTRVVAQAWGDRVELRSLASNSFVTPFYCLDPSTTNAAGRYYRTEYLVSSPPPEVVPQGPNGDGTFSLLISPGGLTPCVVQATTNLLDWTSIYTNSTGNTEEFTDTQATGGTRRFYRILALASQRPALPDPTVQVLTNANGLLVRVEGAAQPYIILGSTNQVNWTALATNLAPGQAQVAVSASAGSGGTLTTGLTPSRSVFLDSPANGYRGFNITGTIAVGSWLQLSVTRTNGLVSSVSVTNLVGGTTLLALAQQLVEGINNNPLWQGSDGLVAEDLAINAMGSASFNLWARGAGRDAAAIQAQLTAGGGLGSSPSSAMRLNFNLSDLQSRNHLYLSAGTTNLALSFPLNTALLADGSHELTAVAYEGTHVCTQTRATVPVQVRNSNLAATLTFLDFGDTAAAQGTYHIQVAANTNNVSSISLFTTGGLVQTLANQPTATFAIDATALAAGRHPFYAQVQTTAGLQYRTPVRWVRLVNAP